MEQSFVSTSIAMDSTSDCHSINNEFLLLCLFNFEQSAIQVKKVDIQPAVLTLSYQPLNTFC